MNENIIINYFNSDNFWKILSKINVPKTDINNKIVEEENYKNSYKTIVNVIIGVVVKFYLLFQDEVNKNSSILDDFLLELIKEINIDLEKHDFRSDVVFIDKYDEIILNFLKKYLNITSVNSDNVNIILKKIFEKYAIKDYMFHSFNQNLLESIKENGITTRNKYNNKNEEELIKIFYQYGLIDKPYLQTTNTDINEVCYASSAFDAYAYGLNNPEWFANFCVKFSSYKNYHERNYELLLNDYKKFISKLPEPYIKEAIDYFNKQWKYYGSTDNKPIMSIIYSDNDASYNDYKDNLYKTYGNSLEEKLLHVLNDDCLRNGSMAHTDYIDTSNALFIQLPSYKKLIELSNNKYYGEKKEVKNNSLEELSKYFNSEQFYNLVNSYNKTDILRSRIRELTNYIIKYSLIIGVEEINIFAKNFVDLCNNGYEEEKAYIELIKKGVTNILERNNIAVTENSIKEYLSSKLGNSIFKFHAFNSSKLESIKKYGLTTNLSSIFEEKNDIARIEEIIKKYTYPDSRSLFGFYRKSSKDKVYYSLDPVNSYSYANRSPEWFASFVGDSYFYSQEKQGTFFEKDYDKAKDNICEFMNSYNFDDEDKKDVLNFFEKYWNVYGNSKPMLTIIEEKYDNSYLKELNLDTFIKELIKGNVDASTHEKISTENAEFIYLTDYVKIKNYINNNEYDKDVEEYKDFDYIDFDFKSIYKYFENKDLNVLVDSYIFYGGLQEKIALDIENTGKKYDKVKNLIENDSSISINYLEKSKNELQTYQSNMDKSLEKYNDLTFLKWHIIGLIENSFDLMSENEKENFVSYLESIKFNNNNKLKQNICNYLHFNFYAIYEKSKENNIKK